jgi:hypothetical protein
MKTLRIIAFTLAILALAAPAGAELKGWGLAGSLHDGDFGVQVRKDFWLGGDISQISGQGSIYFPDKTTFKLDVDYHFVLNPEDSGRFYPLAGLQFAFNSARARFGVNGGGGVNFMLTETLAAFAEAKYVFSDWNGFTFTFGIYF